MLRVLWDYIIQSIVSYGKNIQRCRHIIFVAPVGMQPASTGPSRNEEAVDM
jgi:hypothetical protein